MTFRLCAEYENIAEKALTTPANTEQLMELKQFIITTEKVGIYNSISVQMSKSFL